jgi:hydrogenase nickel incorporation protein HypA/HybF
MHESSLAREVLAIVLAKAEGSPRVRAVYGKLAETESLSRDALELHFGALARGTAAEGARLEIALVHARARCRACGETWLPEHHVMLCPRCASAECDELDPTGLWVDRIEVSER